MSEPFDKFRNARRLAAREVLSRHRYRALISPEEEWPSEEYELRRIKREYSMRHLPGFMHVEDLPLDYLLQHYYEAIYDEMSESRDPEGAHAWNTELEELAESPEQRMVRLREEAEFHRGNDEAVEKLRREEAEKDKLYGPVQLPGQDRPGERKGSGLGERGFAEAQREVASWGRGKGIGETNLPGGRSINMKFPP